MTEEKKQELADEALKCSNRAIALNPYISSAYTNKGLALSLLGMDITHEQELQAYNQALEIDDQCTSAFYNKACLYALNNNIPKVIENLTMAIRINPDMKELAKTDGDFESVRNSSEFIALIS